MTDVHFAPRDLVRNVIDASYTVQTTDVGKAIDVADPTGTVTITIPTNAAQPIPVGAIIEVASLTDEVVIVNADSGVTMFSFDLDNPATGSTSSRTLGGRYGSAAIRKVDTDEWLLVGNLSSLS